MRRQSAKAAHEADVRSLVVSLLAATGAARRVADAPDADERLEVEAKAMGGFVATLYERLEEKEPARDRRSEVAAAAARGMFGEPASS